VVASQEPVSDPAHHATDQIGSGDDHSDVKSPAWLRGDGQDAALEVVKQTLMNKIAEATWLPSLQSYLQRSVGSVEQNEQKTDSVKEDVANPAVVAVKLTSQGDHLPWDSSYAANPETHDAIQTALQMTGIFRNDDIGFEFKDEHLAKTLDTMHDQLDHPLPNIDHHNLMASGFVFS
jgi:hypothetical protein